MQANIDRVETGWDVIGSDDQKIGEINDVGDNYLVLTKGLIFVKDIYVPFDAIQSVDDNAACVYVDATKDDIESMGWENPPAAGAIGSDWDLSAAGGSTTSAGSRSSSMNGGDADFQGTTTDRDSLRVPVHEEQLQASTQREQAGAVDVRKNVREERREMDVPVTHEEVTVRRVPAGRDAATDGNAFQDEGTIRVPVTAETVNVSKEPRVVEEIEISKRPVTETQRVSETVRREEVDVDDEGDVRRTGERELAGAGSSNAMTGSGDWQTERGTSGVSRSDLDDEDLSTTR